MKKALTALLFMAVLSGAEVNAAPSREEGASSSGTIVSIAVTTTPALILSTGSLMSWGPVVFTPLQTTATPNPGQMFWGRVALELYNDTGYDVWLGYDNRVSSQAGSSYGRRIPTGTSYSHECSIPDHWIVSGTTLTPTKLTVIQER